MTFKSLQYCQLIENFPHAPDGRCAVVYFFLKVTSVFLYVALLIAAVPYCRLHFSWALGDIYVLWGAWGNISFQTSEKQTLQL